MAREHGFKDSGPGLVGQVISVSPERVCRFEGQPRRNFNKKKLEGLAKSIEKVGQKKPGEIMPITDNPDCDFGLVDGERRWLACQLAGKDFRALVVETKGEEERFFDSVLHNMAGEPHTDLEYAFAVEKMVSSKRLEHLNIGERVLYIADSLNMSESTVERYRALLRLDPKVQELMSEERDEDDRLGGVLAYFISSLHPELQIKVATTALEKKLTINQARLLARQLAHESGQESPQYKDHSPRRDFSAISNFTRRVKNDLEVFLAPMVVDSLLRRGEKDMATVVAEINLCIGELERLRNTLSVKRTIGAGPKLESEVPTPAPTKAVPVPASVPTQAVPETKPVITAKVEADKRPSVFIDKAAEMLGVSRRTIYNWVRGGYFETTTTLGGSTRIFTDTLDRNPGGKRIAVAQGSSPVALLRPTVDWPAPKVETRAKPSSLPQRKVAHEPAPEPVPTHRPPPVQKSETQPFELSNRVIRALFYSGDFLKVNLSMSRLQATIGNGADPQKIADLALEAAEACWRVSPRGGKEEQSFIRLVSRLRSDLQNERTFDEGMTRAIKLDRSFDPITMG